jgi:hypothetical protein
VKSEGTQGESDGSAEMAYRQILEKVAESYIQECARMVTTEILSFDLRSHAIIHALRTGRPYAPRSYDGHHCDGESNVLSGFEWATVLREKAQCPVGPCAN